MYKQKGQDFWVGKAPPKHWRRQLWCTGAHAPLTSNDFIFSLLWSKSDSQVLCSLRVQLLQMSTTRSCFDQYTSVLH